MKKIVDVPSAYSKEELLSFLDVSREQYPALRPLIEEYLKLAERSDSNFVGMLLPINRSTKIQMHLFDMLREKKFFPQNSDLADFATRVLPHLRTHRFDKMSRADIAARIIEFLEESDSYTRQNLESSMRQAMAAPPERVADRRSFLTKWEKIIKGIDL